MEPPAPGAPRRRSGHCPPGQSRGDEPHRRPALRHAGDLPRSSPRRTPSVAVATRGRSTWRFCDRTPATATRSSRRPTARRPSRGWTNIRPGSSSTGTRSGRKVTTASGFARTRRRRSRRRPVRARRPQPGPRVRDLRELDERVTADIAAFDAVWKTLVDARVIWRYMTFAEAVRFASEELAWRQTEGPVGVFEARSSVLRLLGYKSWLTLSADSPLVVSRAGHGAREHTRSQPDGHAPEAEGELHRGRSQRRRQQSGDGPIRQPCLPDRHGHARRGVRGPGQRARNPGRPFHRAPGGRRCRSPYRPPAGVDSRPIRTVRRIMSPSARRAPWRSSRRMSHGTQPVRPSHPDVAKALDLTPAQVIPYGFDKAKVTLDALDPGRPAGRLVLVSAITPTDAGEGKTTTSIGLAQGLARLGQRACLALARAVAGPDVRAEGRRHRRRAGARRARAATSTCTSPATSTPSAPRTTCWPRCSTTTSTTATRSTSTRGASTWRRVIDMNDRALRHVVIGLGGVLEGVPRETGFDITPASEVMAALCLSESDDDLRRRLSRIVVALNVEKRPVTAADLKAVGAMMVLLKDAMLPNLVQTCDGVPALVHGGPFANIAHGCNSVVATKTGPGPRGLGCHGGGVRLRSRRREVLRHQVRVGRPRHGGRRAGGHRASAEDARRRAEGRSRQARSRCRRAGARQSCEARREHPHLRRAAGGGAEPVRQRHGRGSRRHPRLVRVGERALRRVGRLRERRRGRRRRWRRR